MKQSVMDFELIIAEDDDSISTRKFIAGKTYPFPIQHIQQEDKGFRKCKILNQAINVAQSDYLVFIDGDCIPHPKFIASYLKNMKSQSCFGRRVMLSKKHTQDLLNSKSNLHLFELIKNKSTQLKHAIYLPNRKPSTPKGKGIWGCNWGIHKNYLLEVNGYDEDYTKAGVGEDVDIEWRLRKLGVQLSYAKHNAIVYHLHHDSHYTDSIVAENMALLKEKQTAGKYYCVNGINKNNQTEV